MVYDVGLAEEGQFLRKVVSQTRSGLSSRMEQLVYQIE
jgi:hypothetical protein